MKIKKFVAYAAAASLLVSGCHMKLSKDRAREMNDYINSYVSTITDDDFVITAHRGFSSLEVENTSSSISLAASKDYIDMIEMDARMTKDGKIVLSHSSGLDSVYRGSIDISRMNFEDVLDTEFIYRRNIFKNYTLSGDDKELILDRNISLVNRKYHVVGLKEGIEEAGDKGILLDLKFNNDRDRFVRELKRELDGVDTSNIIFQSLDIDGIRYLQNNSDFNCLALVDTVKEIDEVKDFKRVGFKHTVINYQLIDSLLRDGVEVAVWTINNTDTLNKVIDTLGDHYKDVIYITDYPDLVVTKLHDTSSKILTRKR